MKTSFLLLIITASCVDVTLPQKTYQRTLISSANLPMAGGREKTESPTTHYSSAEITSKEIHQVKNNVKELQSNFSHITSKSLDQMDNIAQIRKALTQLSVNFGEFQTNCKSSADLYEEKRNSTLQQEKLGDVDANFKLKVLHKELNSVKSKTVEMDKILNSLEIDMNNLYSELNSIKSDYFLCQRRGLQVSGKHSYITNQGISSSSGKKSIKARINATSAWCPGTFIHNLLEALTQHG